MLTLIWRQARRRPYRGLALITAILIAASGFALLTGTVQQSKLTVNDFVAAHSRGAYDLLVRPAGTRSGHENGAGLVRPGFLTGQGHGLTRADWQAVRQIGGVQIAAPAGVVGYVGVQVDNIVDLSAVVEKSLVSQVVRISPRVVADAGMTTIVDPEPRFAYVTSRQIAVPSYVFTEDGKEGYLDPDGRILAQVDLLELGCANVQIPFAYLEKSESGRWEPLCGTQYLAPVKGVNAGSPQLNMSTFAVFQALPDGSYLDFTGVGEIPDKLSGVSAQPRHVPKVTVTIRSPLWLPVGVIDPQSESDLVDLPKALNHGRYLPDSVGSSTEDSELEVPALIASRLPIDEKLIAEAEKIVSGPVTGQSPAELLTRLTNASPQSKSSSSHDLSVLYEQQVAASTLSSRLDLNVRVGRPGLAEQAGALTAQVVVFGDNPWRTTVSAHGEQAVGRQALQPLLASDTVFRPIHGGAFAVPADGRRPPQARIVGSFDPGGIRGFSEFAAVPLDLYEAGVSAVTPAGRKEQLRPNSSPASYLALPPSMLISVEAAVRLAAREDVIGAIRVKVAGVQGVDPKSRELVRLAAQEIARIPGLEVDITLGSSPQEQTVLLPAGQHGRPAMSLAELWPRKGVATKVIAAIDSKSVFLFGLVLAVCLCFLANAAVAAVRDRRRELAILSCLGWSSTRTTAFVLFEAAGIGAVAGILAIPVGYGLGVVTDAEVSWASAAWALPASITITTLAALVPAIGAARAHPIGAVSKAATPANHQRGSAGMLSLAWSYMRRSPGRSTTTACSVAVTAVAICLMLSVEIQFKGNVVGTLLGNAVSVQITATDAVMVMLLALMALATTADLLYIGLRERSSELNTLRALGWAEARIRALAAIEALAVAGIGAIAGCAVAAVAISWIFGAMAAPAIAAIGATGTAIAVACGVCGFLAAVFSPRLDARSLNDEG